MQNCYWEQVLAFNPHVGNVLAELLAGRSRYHYAPTSIEIGGVFDAVDPSCR